jgi:18S rRNA (adenine1779-N6/adenine1780-N6)-dimethyltransferase
VALTLWGFICLQEIGFEDKRSAKLSQDEFLQLLAAFNRAGIHFA